MTSYSLASPHACYNSWGGAKPSQFPGASWKLSHAIFENGVFRPTVPVSFPDRCEVEIEAKIVNGELKQDLDAIYAVMSQRYNTGETDLAERHNEHQP